MKAIPSELNFDSLVGSKLIQVCLGEHDIQFHFCNSVSISGSGTVTVTREGIEKKMNGENGLSDSSPISNILGEQVTAWKKESSHCLSISLGEKKSILFTSEDSPYEDFIALPSGLVW